MQKGSAKAGPFSLGATGYHQSTMTLVQDAVSLLRLSCSSARTEVPPSSSERLMSFPGEALDQSLEGQGKRDDRGVR